MERGSNLPNRAVAEMTGNSLLSQPREAKHGDRFRFPVVRVRSHPGAFFHSLLSQTDLFFWQPRTADPSTLSLEQIRKESGVPIVRTMEEIQTTAMPRDKASGFVRHLKCLLLTGDGSTITFKDVRRNGFVDEVAILSWPWQCSIYESSETGSCYIEDYDGSVRTSRVRNSIMRRVAAYMRYMGVRYGWIDAECIAQDNEEEVEEGMHATDMLYHFGSHPFGLLARPIETKIHLHLLAKILDGQLAYKSRRNGKFYLREGTEIAYAWKAIELLGMITSDIWWTRAWIYQENYHGGERMNLLIPHSSVLEPFKAKYKTMFGNLEGELIIRSIKFSEEVTKLCSAFMTLSSARDFQRQVAGRVLSVAGRYSLLLENQTSMSPTIIADVHRRRVSEPFDRLAIVANCCAYNIRLDGGVLQNKGYSAGLAMLTLPLLNGEIFQYEPEELRDAMSASAMTVVDFIKKYAFANFSPPGSKYKLTFNKSCRLVDVRLEAGGVHTSGHLWQLDEQLITVPCQPSRRRDTVKTLWLLHSYIQGLGQAPLARRLKEFIAQKTSPLAPEEHYMWAMADALAAAVHGGSKLRLGYTCNSSKGPPLPMGIFVCSDEAAESPRSAFVFTSFKRRETPIWPAFTSDVDRHVSLQVDVDDNGNLPPKLFARAWMHGLYFPIQRQQPVVFPLPRILNEL